MILLFKKPEPYPEFGDYIARVFPFEVLTGDTPQNEPAKQQFSVLMKLSGPLRTQWEDRHGREFTQSELQRIMFAFATRHLHDSFGKGESLRDHEIRLLPSCGMSEVLPFDLEQVPDPEGTAVEIRRHYIF